MAQRFKDSGLDGLKGSIQYCPDCRRSTAHYRTPDGWPICYACGYNAHLVQLVACDELAAQPYDDRHAA